MNLGTAEARFDALMDELEKRFPTPPSEAFRSDVLPESRYLAAIDMLLAGMEPLSGLHPTPDVCPTYYDGCHCTAGALEHSIKRAEAAEAKLEALETAP